MIRDFQVATTPKRLQIDIQLELDTNRKSYMRSPMTPLDFTLSKLESAKSRSFTF